MPTASTTMATATIAAFIWRLPRGTISPPVMPSSVALWPWSPSHDFAEQLIGLLANATARLRAVAVDQVSEQCVPGLLRLDDRSALRLLLVVRHLPTLLHRCRGDDHGG